MYLHFLKDNTDYAGKKQPTLNELENQKLRIYKKINNFLFFSKFFVELAVKENENNQLNY